MNIVSKVSELSVLLKGVEGIVGLVPTMGALHRGHISLVDKARSQSDIVVVSIFVNPTQFNDLNDLKNYPRDLESDLKMLQKAGVDIVFAPEVNDIYPEPDTRQLDFGGVDSVMEGAHRPGHFNGVGQVVSRLFSLIAPHKAYFGEKDFQQMAVIRYMVSHEKFNVEIVGCPIVRDVDGLALSSRNALLTPKHRAAAPTIYAALQEAASKIRELGVEQSKKLVIDKINGNTLLEVEYFNIVDAETLIEVTSLESGVSLRGCVAVRAGSVRLIDNIELV